MLSLRPCSRPALRRSVVVACGITVALCAFWLSWSALRRVSDDFDPGKSGAFFRDELSRVAPELAGRDLMEFYSTWSSNASGPARSQFTVYFVDAGEQCAGKSPVHYVRLEGKPVHGGRDVEVSVFTGLANTTRPNAARNRSTLAATTPVNHPPPETVKENLYRRLIHPVDY